MKTVNGLGSQNARETWEYLFNRAYIQPVLEVCNTLYQHYKRDHNDYVCYSYGVPHLYLTIKL